MTEQQIIETLATKVMGWKAGTFRPTAAGWEIWSFPEGGFVLRENWNPLQNIADAMQVIESFEQYCLERTGSSRMCEIFIHGEVYRGQGANMTEAICQAALKAAA